VPTDLVIATRAIPHIIGIAKSRFPLVKPPEAAPPGTLEGIHLQAAKCAIWWSVRTLNPNHIRTYLCSELRDRLERMLWAMEIYGTYGQCVVTRPLLDWRWNVRNGLRDFTSSFRQTMAREPRTELGW
jgi:hypothetical protein